MPHYGPYITKDVRKALHKNIHKNAPPFLYIWSNRTGNLFHEYVRASSVGRLSARTSMSRPYGPQFSY